MNINMNDTDGVNVNDQDLLVQLNRNGLQTIKIDELKAEAKLYVRNQIFPKKQFTMDDELKMGSKMQKLICRHLKIDSQQLMEAFWVDWGGKETIRDAIRRKRQVVMTAVKLSFRSK